MPYLLSGRHRWPSHHLYHWHSWLLYHISCTHHLLELPHTNHYVERQIHCSVELLLPGNTTGSHSFAHDMIQLIATDPSLPMWVQHGYLCLSNSQVIGRVWEAVVEEVMEYLR